MGNIKLFASVLVRKMLNFLSVLAHDIHSKLLKCKKCLSRNHKPVYVGASKHPHQITLQHAAPLTRAPVTDATSVPDPLPITDLSVEWMKAECMRRDSRVGSGDWGLSESVGRKNHFE